MSKSEELNSALLRADLWRVLALAFSTPSRKSLEDLQGLCDELASTLSADGHPLQEGLAELGQSIELLDPSALEHEHNALFSMDVMVPAYEGSYQRIERGALVGDVAGYFAAFGLSTIDHSGPPDSIWNELALLSWLSLKEGYAIEHEWEEPRTITQNAMREFLQDHLGRWVGVFSSRLLHTTDNPLYTTATHLLLATVSLVADELEVGAIQALDGQDWSDEPDAVVCPVACPAS